MLDSRKLQVLYAIINSHIITAEPIGSRTISKDYDLGVSSATIRNEMSDLEDQGYLNKPHSSAGRVPSDKAYRLYVNEILKLKRPDLDLDFKDKLEEVLLTQSMELEDIIEESARALSKLTSYTALALSPKLDETRLKKLQLMAIDRREVLMVIVTNSGIIKNFVIKTSRDISEDEMLILTNILNDRFVGFTIDEIMAGIKLDIFRDLPEHKELLDDFIPVINKAFNDIRDVNVYSDGITKILNFPEYRDLDKAKSIINFIQNKELMVDLLTTNIGNEIEIIIGSENEYEEMKDSSIITTTYRLGDKTIGKIGIVGPTRMDYVNLIKTIDIFSRNINEIISTMI